MEIQELTSTHILRKYLLYKKIIMQLKTRIILILVIMTFIIAICTFYRGQSEYCGQLSLRFMRKDVVIQHIHTRPDWRKLFAFDSNPNEIDYLQMKMPGQVAIDVSDMKQFAGVVNIKDKSEALDYVRLRTSPGFWYSFNEPAVEVISRSQLPKLPHYYSRASVRYTYSGHQAIISDEAYLEGHFHPPVIRKHNTSYIITRWLLGPFPYGVNEVDESVGNDGSYNVVRLRDIGMPKLTGTTWDNVRNRHGW